MKAKLDSEHNGTCVETALSATAKIFVCQCATVDDFDPLKFEINGQTYEILPDQYIDFTQNASGPNQCTLYVADLGHNFLIFSDSFFYNHYVVFDYDDDRVGIVARTAAKSESSAKEAAILGATVLAMFGISLIL